MISRALQKVFRKPAYVVLALVVSASIFALTVWLPNIRLVAGIVSSPDVPFVSKIKLPLSFLGSIATNFTLLSASYTIAVSILFGIYIAMVVYFLKHRIKEIKQSGIATGFLGITSSVFGIGCAACGSFFLTSILSIFGASSALSLLPLGGSEFGVIGVILIALAIYIVAKQIENPMVCKV